MFEHRLRTYCFVLLHMLLAGARAQCTGASTSKQQQHEHAAIST
jgi:hypothetical protein